MSPVPLQLVWGDGFVSVQPTFPETLLKQLSYWRRVTDLKGWKKVYLNQHEELYVIESYEDPTEPGVIKRRLTAMDGFMFKIKKALTDAGYPFTVVDVRTPRPVPDIAKALEQLWDVQKPAAYTALMSGGGIISLPTGGGKTRIAASIISAYSKDKLQLRGTPLTVFAAPERDINAKNYEEIKAVLKDRDVGIMQSGRKQVITVDVMCVTLDSLQNIDPTQVGLLIVDEVHTGVSDTRSANIQDMRTAIKFGVSATPGGRYDGKDLVIEALFGPVVYTKTYQDMVNDNVLVPIKVVWIEAPEPDLGLKYYLNLSSREGKIGNAVTRNTGCNRVIGEIMKTLPKDMQAIAIMPTIEQMSNILHWCKDGNQPVFVAHGETDAQALIDRDFPNVPALSTKARKELYQAMEAGTVKRTLATYVYKQGVNFPSLEVMINAGGGGGEIAAKQIPGRVSRTVTGKDKAWLIDFWHPWDTKKDKFNRSVPGPVNSDDRKRKKFYAELGFEQVFIKDLSELTPLLTVESLPEPIQTQLL